MAFIGGNGSPFLRVKRPRSGFYPVHQAGRSLGETCLVCGSHIAICDCFITRYESCINPNLLSPLQPLKPDIAPKLITLPSILVKVLQEVDVTHPRNKTTPSHGPPWFQTASWFCPSLIPTTFSVTRGLRGTCCSLCIILPWGPALRRVAKAQTH